MDEKMREVVEQYDLHIKNVYRFRGAYMLETHLGLCILREFRGTNSKAQLAQIVKEKLEESGFTKVDTYIRNKEGEIVTENIMGNRYVIKKWYIGEECNLKDSQNIKEAAGNLGVLHSHLRGIMEEPLVFQGDTFPQMLYKHNRELRRVRSYIREKKQRNEFELLFLSMFSEFYQEAEEAEALLEQLSCQELYEDLEKQQILYHGGYNYHNILMTSQGIATTSFEKVQLQLQVLDLYDFIRKIMEKNNWNEQLFQLALEGYEEKRELLPVEKQILYIALVYPEKFWKVTNFYYNRKKTWISAKNIEKLQGLQQQKNIRRGVLKKIQSLCV